MIKAPTVPASPLRGRYLIRNPALNAWLRLLDTAVTPFARPELRRPTERPRRLLIAIGGHLGDAVIATSVLPALARWSPETELGMLLPSSARVVVDGHPRLRWIHAVDHWKTSRSTQRLIAKWSRYRSTRRCALREIAAVGYDVAIDLYAYYPNMARLLRSAGIPVRIGYRSGGCGPLYTRAIDWNFTHEHTAIQHLRLLGALDPDFVERIAASDLRYDLPPLDAADRVDTDTVLDSAGLDRGGFVVLHPGTGAAHKAWPMAHWRELAARLRADEHRVVVTGTGIAEAKIAKRILQDIPDGVNWCGQLSWREFRGVMYAARAVVGVDSVAVHVAAGDGTPCVAIMPGVNDIDQWRPLGERCAVVTNLTPCAPCFRNTGCAMMECIREVSVDAVLETLGTLVELRDARAAVPLAGRV